jgi:DNA-binding NarL/FixJ family response regulator
MRSPDLTFPKPPMAMRCLCNWPVLNRTFLLLDINMPGRSGFEVLKDVKRIYSKLPVIMVSVQAESQYALRCIRAGASQYVNKDSASEELVPAIKKIMGSGLLTTLYRVNLRCNAMKRIHPLISIDALNHFAKLSWRSTASSRTHFRSFQA